MESPEVIKNRINKIFEGRYKFIEEKTGLPLEVVQRMGKVKIPERWYEELTTMVKDINRPGVTDLCTQMFEEKISYIKAEHRKFQIRLGCKNLTEIERKKIIIEMEEFFEANKVKELIEDLDEYMEKLHMECGVSRDVAETFLRATGEWQEKLKEELKWYQLCKEQEKKRI